VELTAAPALPIPAQPRLAFSGMDKSLTSITGTADTAIGGHNLTDALLAIRYMRDHGVHDQVVGTSKELEVAAAKGGGSNATGALTSRRLQLQVAHSTRSLISFFDCEI